jgi:RNA polymerase sigma factor (sigma-70 family)
VYGQVRPPEATADGVEATEQVAVTRVRSGDPDSYAQLVRIHARAAYRTAVVFGAGVDAEDVVQIAFVKAYEGLPRFRDGAPFRPWLLRIVVNEAKNLARSNGRAKRAWHRHVQLEIDVPPSDPDRVALSADRRRALVHAIRELPPTYQQVVACRYFLDLDEQETAKVLGWPRGTVKSRLFRALLRLREILDDGLGDHDF